MEIRNKIDPLYFNIYLLCFLIGKRSISFLGRTLTSFSIKPITLESSTLNAFRFIFGYHCSNRGTSFTYMRTFIHGFIWPVFFYALLLENNSMNIYLHAAKCC